MSNNKEFLQAIIFGPDRTLYLVECKNYYANCDDHNDWSIIGILENETPEEGYKKYKCVHKEARIRIRELTTKIIIED